ncbi:MAG TPA: SDR family NAD(P)-dependent oxidoreductase [Burkholderiales bacterium]|jgi:NAD(P)-dependent dehydrogenase (short-subunit alcohol dehydrogenase family)|nr:SDR family NAD(P)-dependent oxidoreductase [Burkholderiales bacterium]
MADKAGVLIVGAGSGLSASLARLFAAEGMKVSLAARGAGKLAELAKETGAQVFTCDATQAREVDELFTRVDPGVVVYNPSYRVRGPLVDLDREEVRKTLMVSAYGGFLVGQAAAKRMLPRGSGAIFFTGASASVKGYAESAPFAMGKFALRGLAQSMARELAPRGIHVAHFVIDGRIGREGDSQLHPDEIARNYLHVYRQSRSAWSWEVELRPWVEKF